VLQLSNEENILSNTTHLHISTLVSFVPFVYSVNLEFYTILLHELNVREACHAWHGAWGDCTVHCTLTTALNKMNITCCRSDY
jgi:hypothetical protein